MKFMMRTKSKRLFPRKIQEIPTEHRDAIQYVVGPLKFAPSGDIKWTKRYFERYARSGIIPNTMEVEEITVLLCKTVEERSRALTIEGHTYIIIDIVEYDFIGRCILAALTSNNIDTLVFSFISYFSSEVLQRSDSGALTLEQTFAELLMRFKSQSTEITALLKDLRCVVGIQKNENLRHLVMAFLIGHEVGHHLYKTAARSRFPIMSHLDRAGDDLVSFYDAVEAGIDLQDPSTWMVYHEYMNSVTESGKLNKHLTSIAIRCRDRPKRLKEELFADFWAMQASMFFCRKIGIRAESGYALTIFMSKFVPTCAAYRSILVAVLKNPISLSAKLKDFEVMQDRHEFFNSKMIGWFNGEVMIKIALGRELNDHCFFSGSEEFSRIRLSAELSNNFFEHHLKSTVFPSYVLAEVARELSHQVNLNGEKDRVTI